MVEVRSCSCREKLIRKNRKDFADVPEAFDGTKISNFVLDYYTGDGKGMAKNAVKTARMFIDHFPEMSAEGLGLYLWSETKGSGKTRLAASIANELVDSGYRVKFATSPAILQAVRASWDRSQKGEPEEKIIYDLIAADLLIIDDFGTEEVKPWIEERFYNIVNERYINCKPTIYTSNIPIRSLKYDGRIVNRIQERSEEIQFPETSVRLIKQYFNHEKFNELRAEE